MPYLKTPSGMNWHYEVEGRSDTQRANRTPLLFLHGFGVNSRIWKQQIKHFSDRHQVIALDLPGHGFSDWQQVSLKTIADDAAFILSALQYPAVGIVASSFGGLVALKMLELHPALIKFFVFAGSQPKFCQSQDHPYGLERTRIHKLAGQLDSDYPSMVHIFFRSLFTRHERETRRFKWIHTFRKSDSIPQKAALINFLSLLEHEDLRETFGKLTLPVLFVNGTEDYICQRGFYENLKDKLPSAEYVWFEKCGHFPFLSQPHEFNSAVEKFIDDI
jgi:pimeloyl-[acyl-carrier protein] methyl ester esterase